MLKQLCQATETSTDQLDLHVELRDAQALEHLSMGSWSHPSHIDVAAALQMQLLSLASKN